VIEDWAPLPVGEADVERLAANEAGEYRVVALSGERIVGVASLAAEKGELIACYVHPDHAGAGIGTLLLRAIDAEARRFGLKAMETDSSINAQAFYAARGYEVLRATTHCLSGGREMQAIRMRKQL
jgi:putative acetyltransferase